MSEEAIGSETSSNEAPALSFPQTIRLSCESHAYNSSSESYAGFLIYGWKDSHGRVLSDWWLNGKHCKNAYLVVQSSESAEVNDCLRAEAPGGLQGAVYWSVFGKHSDMRRAVGEGFLYASKEVCDWSSSIFSTTDFISDNDGNASDMAMKCVQRILDDWRNTSQVGKIYSVKDLLAADSSTAAVEKHAMVHD